MKINKQIITYLVLFVLVFLVAYCLGLNIINLINRRLENIAIKMPTIEVGAPQISIHYDPSTGGFKSLPSTHFVASTETQMSQMGGGCGDATGCGSSEPQISWAKATPGCGINPPKVGCLIPPVPTVSTNQTRDASCPSSLPPAMISTPDNKISQSLCKDLKTAKEACDPNQIVCQCDTDCNKVFGGGTNQCIGGKCQCRYGAGDLCQQQPTYYLDPKQMSPPQVIKFKNRAKLSVMTLQDYKNWLSLFEFEVDSLPLVHRKNYWRMMKGDTINTIPTAEEVGVTDGWESPGYTTDANGSIIPNAMPEDVREYRSQGGRVPQADINNPNEDSMYNVKMKIPISEVDTQLNYRFVRRDNSTGNVHNFSKTKTGLSYTDYSDAFEANHKYVEYDDKVVPFRTTLSAQYYSNNAPALSDLVESTAFDPLFRCNS